MTPGGVVPMGFWVSTSASELFHQKMWLPKISWRSQQNSTTCSEDIRWWDMGAEKRLFLNQLYIIGQGCNFLFYKTHYAIPLPSFKDVIKINKKTYEMLSITRKKSTLYSFKLLIIKHKSQVFLMVRYKIKCPIALDSNNHYTINHGTTLMLI